MGKTVTVKRANVVLTVNADDAERYLKKGYDIFDEDGNIKFKATPSDPGALAKAYEEHKARIAELEAEVAELKAKLRAVPVEAEQPEEPAAEPEEAPAEEAEVVEKKKSTSRKKKS